MELLTDLLYKGYPGLFFYQLQIMIRYGAAYPCYNLYCMGNNHDKYFGSDKRKIVILGL